MKSSFSKAILLAALLALPAVSLSAADASGTTNAPAAKKKPTATKATPGKILPFHGNVATIDKQAMTLAVGNSTYAITSATHIFNADKPATLQDGVVGEEVSGSYRAATDGKLQAQTIRFGAKAEKAPTAKKTEAKPKTM